MIVLYYTKSLTILFLKIFIDVQPPVTPGSNHERFGGMSQLDEEMEVVESAETMEGVEEEAILDERPLCLVKLFGNLKMTYYSTSERKKGPPVRTSRQTQYTTNCMLLMMRICGVMQNC